MTCPTSHHPSPETWWFVIKNEAGPQAKLRKDKSNAFSFRFVIKIAGPQTQLQKDKSNAPTSKSRNNNEFLLKMKLGRRPGFKTTSPMLPHPSLETHSNQQTMPVYERPASMKNWRLEPMLSQDCSRDCQGIWKWRVQRPITQVQKHYDLLLTMKLGRRPSFKRASPMLSH